ncbi:MAG TPA: PatB family C-S lyase [Candidatus Limiplasma sp.]|nr:PatB family C-S lyase [Candidatus Limiplasma sp.]
MKYDTAFFDQSVNRCCTACEKWDGIKQREGKELLPMWVADMDFPCVQEISDALVRRASHPVYGYTYQTDSSVEAMLGFMHRQFGLSLTKDEQAIMPCVVTGLKAAVHVFTKPGDTVLIQPPVYGPFSYSILKNGRKIARNSLLRDAQGRYSMNFAQMEEQLKSGTKLMILCNPHNPVGRVWSRAELEQMYTLCKRYGTTVVVDEIHAGFVYDRDAFTSMLLIDQAKDAKIVVLNSATKTFNIAGLQQSVLLTRNQALKDQMTEYTANVGAVSGNIFGLEATEAAYRYGDDWLRGLLAYLDEARTIVKEELAKRLPEAILSPIEATYMGWMDLRAYGLTSAELMDATHRQGVAFTDGQFFDKELGDGFLRINFACPHCQTRKALELLEKAVKENLPK